MDKLLAWTGERLVTSIKSIGAIEHLHRYAVALDLVCDKVVLDIASGEGYGSNLLAKNAKQVIGVDISEEAIGHSSNKYKRANLNFRLGSITNIPLEDSSIDVVVSFETLEHVYEQEEMIRELKRVLKPGGLLIISSPEKSNYEDVNKEKNQFHLRELYFNELEQLIKSNFLNYSFLFQKSVYGTLVVPQSSKINEFSELSGDFNCINSYSYLKNPVFNICLASDQELPEVNISFFDAQVYYNLIVTNFQERINNILNSKTYQVGKVILHPYRKLKKWIIR